MASQFQKAMLLAADNADGCAGKQEAGSDAGSDADVGSDAGPDAHVVFDLWRRLDGAAADRGAGLDDHFGGLFGGGEFLGLLLRVLLRLGLVLGLGGEQPAAAAAVVVRLDLQAMNAQAGHKIRFAGVFAATGCDARQYVCICKHGSYFSVAPTVMRAAELQKTVSVNLHRGGSLPVASWQAALECRAGP